MSADNKKHGLGRGLEALFGDDVISWEEIDEAPKIEKIVENTVFKATSNEIEIAAIKPCRFQPRQKFDDEAMQTLCQSIKEKGILQPLLLRHQGNGYEIIAGERRWRAAQMVGLKTVPAVVKDVTADGALEIALSEHLQRENLTPIEEAEGINRLLQDFAYTQEDVSKVVGRSRSYITNSLRLLLLPESVREAVNDGKLSAGHARALAGVENAADLAEEVMARDLSVRQTEKLVAASKRLRPRVKPSRLSDADLEQIMHDLEEKLKLRVKISAGKNGKGSVTLHYRSPAELSAILDILEQR